MKSYNTFLVAMIAALFSALSPLVSHSQDVTIPTNLHDSVPYQGDTLLVNPLPMNVHDTDQAYLDCDWVTLMSMIRDLEERIATALEVDTVYDVYVSGQVVGTSIYMNYDCVVLRDSIISLQIELDEALLGPPSVLSQEVMGIAQNVATIKAKITDDGGAPVRLWGVIFGKHTWWNDTLGFFHSDSLDIANLTDYTTVLDSTLATRWEAMDNYWSGPYLPGTYPELAVMDTASLNVDSVFVTSIKGLDRYTEYIAVPIAANDSLFAEMMQPPNFEASELNVGPFGWYGMGDTLMFRTLPDTASGFTLDTANVLQNTARLIFTVSDAGGQGPDAAGFFYDTLNFTTATFAGDSIASDSTGGMTHTAELTGLTRYTDYYFRGYADNLGGRGNSESSFTFKTLPDIPTFDTVYFDSTVDSLYALIDDNGGVVPTTQGFKYAEGDATMASPSSLIGALVGDLFSAELLQSALTAGQNYYAAANATNVAGTGYSDTIQFITPPAVTTAAATALGEEALTINGSVSYAQAGPDSVGFQWATDSALAGASDTTVVEQSDSTFMATLTGLAPGTKYYFAAEATNSGGTKTGSTLYGATRASAAADSAVRTAPPAAPSSPAPGMLFSPVPSSNEVHYKFTATADFDNAAPTAQIVVYSYDSDFSDSVLLTVPSLVNQYGIEAEDGLNWGAQLYFYAAVANEAGTSHSDTLTVYTVPEVTSVAASSIGETSLTINGLVGYDDAAPSSVGFNWATDSALAGASDTTVVEQTDSTFMATLTGLAPGTKYYFAAEAANAGGTESGDTLSTATLVAVTADSILKLPAYGFDNKYKFFGTGTFSNSLPTTQQCVYSYEPDLSDSIVASASFLNSRIEAPQNDLNEGAEVHFYFEVTNESGMSRSDTLQVFTYLGVDTEPANSLSDTTLQLNGTVNWTDSIAMPTSVGFNWGTTTALSADTVVPLASNNSLSAVLTGLEPGKKYYFQATGTNIAGEETGDGTYGATKVGVLSDTVRFRMNPYRDYQIITANMDYDNAPATGGNFAWSYSPSLSESTADMLTIYGPTKEAYIELEDSLAISPGAEFYYQYSITNAGGATASDTLQAFTPVKPVTEQDTDRTDSTTTMNARFVWLHESAKPDSVGFVWSTDVNFPDSASTDTIMPFTSLGLDSTLAVTVPVEFGQHYFVKAKAVNVAGTSFGRVNSFCSIVCPDSIDYEGVTYDITQIGCDCVFAENLQSRVYASGDSIPTYALVNDSIRTIWAGSEVGAMVAMTDAQLDSIGGFYSAQTVIDDALTVDRALCPSGWKIVPSSRFNVIPNGEFQETAWLSWLMDWSDPDSPNLPWYDASTPNASYNPSVVDSLYLAGQTLNPTGYGNNFSGLSVVRHGHYRKNGTYNNTGTPPSALLLTPLDNPFTQSVTVWNEDFGGEIGSDLNNIGILPGGTYAYAGNVRCMSSLDSLPIVYASVQEVVSDTEVILEGRITHDGWRTFNQQFSIEEAGFVWSANEDFSDSTVVVAAVSPSDSISTTLTGLTAGELYWFKAFADNGVETGYSEPVQFVAALPTLPVVHTDEVLELVVDKFSKEWHQLSMTLVHDGNSPIVSAGWKWSTDPNLTGGGDTTQIAGYHQGIESLMLGVDSTYRLDMGQHDRGSISTEDWTPGTTYYYAAYVTNEVGTNWGDTLEIYVPAAIQVGKTITSNFGATVDGVVNYSNNDPMSLSLVWSTSNELVTAPALMGTDVLTQLVDSVWCPAIAASAGSLPGEAVAALNYFGLTCDSTTAYTEGKLLELTELFAAGSNTDISTPAGANSAFVMTVSAVISQSGLTVNEELFYSILGYDPMNPFSSNLAVLPNENAVIGAKMDQLVDVNDTVSVVLAADSTFSVALSFGDTLPVGTEIYFQLLAEHGGAEIRSAVNFFTTGACAPVEFDGYVYPTQKFQDECWFVENLRTEVLANGDSIPFGSAVNSIEWLSTTSPRQYFTDSVSLNDYGRFYNEAALSGLCPTGTHVADYLDWYKLVSASSFAHANTVSQTLTNTGIFTGGMDLASENFTNYVDGTYYSTHSESPASSIANSEDYWKGIAAGGQNISGFNAGGVWQWMDPTYLPGSAPYQFGYWSASAAPASPNNTRVRFRDGEGMYTVPTVSLWDQSVRAGHYVRCVVDDPLAVASIETPALEEISLTSMTLTSTLNTQGVMSLPSEVGFLVGSNADLTGAQTYAATIVGDTLSANVDLSGYNEGDVLYFAAYSNSDVLVDTTSIRSASVMTCTRPTFDGYTYDFVTIGDQCWFAENLRSDNYNDGSAIGTAWHPSTDGAHAIYNNDTISYYEDYGRLYNWYAVNTGLLCPTGWHVPTYPDWTTLYNELGGEAVAGGVLKASASDAVPWDGDNGVGFNGLPGGIRKYYGAFQNLGTKGAWWASTSNSSSHAYSTELESGSIVIPNQNADSKADGLSVRCLRDDASTPTLSTTAASNVTDSTATLNGTLQFDGWDDVTATGFKWGYQPDLSDGTVVAGDTLAGGFSAELTGLAIENTVYFAAFATNALGTSYGDTLSRHIMQCNPAEFDGYTYETVVIGSQCWFAENLRSDNYADGAPIPGGLNGSEWAATTEGAQAIYENDTTYLSNYGRLYNGYAVENAAGLCPSGWHVPSDDEWKSLEMELGMSQEEAAATNFRGTDQSTQMKAASGWDNDGNGSNSSGFTSLPGGNRGGGFFSGAGGNGTWWTSSPSGSWAWFRTMYGANPKVNRGSGNKEGGRSVRCLRDGTSAPVVSTTAASAITGSSATLNGTLQFDGWDDVTTTGFKWGLQPDLSDGTVVAGDTLAGDFSAELTGLILGDTVYFTAYATNALGTSYGDTLSLEPETCVPIEFNGYTYDVVEFADQCWFAENLRSDKYADGTPIPGDLDNAAWNSTTEGAQAIYLGDSATYYADYGRLYNWYAVNNAAGLCPTGWHVPTLEEFTAFADSLGGEFFGAPKMKASASDSPSWDGTNSSGWSGLPGGWRHDGGTFLSIGEFGIWWCSTPSGQTYVQSASVWEFDVMIYFGSSGTNYGMSVRCLLDED